MIQSFIVYGTFALIMAILGQVAALREKNEKLKGWTPTFWVPEIIFSLLVFAVISGIRWDVGVDHLTYLYNYENYKLGIELKDTYEVGFVFISKLFAKADIHFAWYFAFWAFLQIFFIFYAVKNQRYLLPFLGAVIILGSHYLALMNGMRQMLAVCMFIFSIQFIKDRKLLPYLITILIASTIHRSAIILILVYFIPQKDYFKNKYITIGIVIGSIVIGLSPTWMKSIGFIEYLLSFIGYEQYSNAIDLMVDYRRELSFGPRRISLIIIQLISIWFAPSIKKEFTNSNFQSYFNYFVFGIIAYNLFVNTSHIFLRPFLYFRSFQMLTSTYLLYYLRIKSSNVITYINFILIAILTFSYMFLDVIALYGDVKDSSSFKFFWDYANF